MDLYNEYFLRSAVVRGDELVFEFETVDQEVTAALRFVGVRDLRVVQPEDFDPGEADQIEHLLIRTHGAWPRVAFNAGGIEYEFDCAELRVVVESTTSLGH